MSVVRRARRPRTDPEAAREAVLDAAEALLRSGGPGALRLGEIAARAGLSHSNVLYHFSGGMKALEARLGRRIALRLAEELGAAHRDHAGPEPPQAATNARLFAVLGRPENARLIAWMLDASEPAELLPIVASIRSTCELIADHPVFAGLPRDAVLREINDATQLAIAAALGLGLVGPVAAGVFGAPLSEAAFVERLGGVDRTRMERIVGLLTTSQ